MNTCIHAYRHTHTHTHTHTKDTGESVTVWLNSSNQTAKTGGINRQLMQSVPPGLQALDAAQHVQVPGGVLLDHILHVIRTQRLLELLLGNVELHYPAQTAGK